MVQLYLYAADGRALYLVTVQLPMPQALTYLDQTYLWSVANKRYQLYAPPTPVPCSGKPSSLEHAPPPY